MIAVTRARILILLIFGSLTVGMPSTSFAAYYLNPPNLHLKPGTSGRFVVMDDDGNTVNGVMSFSGYDTSVISVSSSGVVTALRAETTTEIGTWVTATINGVPVSSQAIVRVLSTSYNLPYAMIVGANTILYYPTVVQGEVLSGYVSQYQLPTVDEYAFNVQSGFMGGRPFSGAKQVIEVDMGEFETQRVCGISGNPIRIGWNILGQPFNNCFLWDPVYKEPRAPRWFIFYHEMGHNFTLQSRTFARGLGVRSYVEGVATALGHASLDVIEADPNKYPLLAPARTSIATALASDFNYGPAYQAWLRAGADFSAISANSGNGPDLVDGIYLAFRAERPGDFDRRFFKPLQLSFVNQLSSIIENLSAGEEHTIFAALMSAATGRDLSSDFGGTYHYPLNVVLFNRAYAAFSSIVNAPPSAPSWVTVTGTPGAHVRLAWATVPDSTSYTVKRGRVRGSETVLAAGLTTTDFTDGSTIKGLRYYYVVTAVSGSGESVPSYEVSITAGRAIDGDVDSDGKTDLTVYRPSTGVWYILLSSTNDTSSLAYHWGISTDMPVPGDYDGDGKTDLAVYRPSTGTWYILQSSTNYTTYLVYQWGISTDIPLSGDYDGDGKTDLTVYRPSTGTWYILQSSTNYTTYLAYPWGISTDIPVPGDYDGDGKTDLAVYRPSTNYWYILQSSTNYTTYLAYPWGISTDIPVPGDYDGDGKTDPAVYRPSTGTWYILQSSTNYTTYLGYPWGLSTDIPAPGDYDGDGKTDPAVYRPSTGYWYILLSSTNYAAYLAQQWGLGTDIPILQRR